MADQIEKDLAEAKQDVKANDVSSLIYKEEAPYQGDDESVYDGLLKARIVVFGVGGAGCNAVNRMIQDKLDDIFFVAANTDAQALKTSICDHKILLGREVTHGLGAGGEPSLGQKAAEASADQIRKIVKGADMVFVAAGMGGGTGTGAAPVIARIAKASGALTLAVVTKPFSFEGRKRTNKATQGLLALKGAVDSFIVVSNDKLLSTHGDQSSSKAFDESNGILSRAVRTIADLVNKPGLINLDFADVRATLHDSGLAVIGFGEATGPNKASDAARKAVSSPLLEASIRGASRALINVTASPDATLNDIQKAVHTITSTTGKDDDSVIFGETIDNHLKDSLVVSCIATGFAIEEMEAAKDPNALAKLPLPSKAKGNGEGEALPAFLSQLLGKAPVNKLEDSKAKESEEKAKLEAERKEKERISKLESDNLALKEKIATLSMNDALLAKLKDNNRLLGEENAKLTALNDKLVSDSEALNQANKALRQQIESLNNALDVANGKTDFANAQLAALKASVGADEVTRAQSALGAAEEKSVLSQKNRDLENEIDRLNRKIEALEKAPAAPAQAQKPEAIVTPAKPEAEKAPVESQGSVTDAASDRTPQSWYAKAEAEVPAKEEAESPKASDALASSWYETAQSEAGVKPEEAKAGPQPEPAKAEQPKAQPEAAPAEAQKPEASAAPEASKSQATDGFEDFDGQSLAASLLAQLNGTNGSNNK